MTIMKKIYVTPRIEVMGMESGDLLLVSGALEGEADGPALGRDDNWDDEY